MRIAISCVAGLVLGAIVLASAGSAQTSGRAGRWPGQRLAAIALTYDDALGSQLEVAIPQLDAAGLKGTFFLTGREVKQNVLRWRAAATKGHELANHTINHPCARGTYDMPEQYTSEAYSVDVLMTEITVMNGFLQALDGKAAHSLATPCEQNLAGGQDYLAPLQKLPAASYIRDHRTMPGSIMYMSFANSSGADMIQWAEKVRTAGAAGVVVFHGVGGDYLNVSADAHKQLVEYLKAHDREIWTATFSDVMQAATRDAASAPAR
jgi:peptidoglycan/xylan/chitin deacetylase (PgdA/CDA1 family)